ncbi:MAG: SUMF1/EgtB/PvdO family nonheme iron enzyme, partial [Bdellovibrionales bacterium]|nr:SUMF1/EgtB/PvdO family nonheme iron enzyme [Bdellovibrionales bacterium]
MKKAIQCLLGMMLAVLFLPSCHLIEKKEELSMQGTFERKIASASPSFSFRKIPAGEFLMGENQKPVEITRSFEMMATEVTQSQWFSVMRDNPSYFKNLGDCDNHKRVEAERGRVRMCPDHPVERVSYNDVQEFIKKLNY